MKRTAAVAELKAKLSRFLRRVKAGEEILVVERGVPVARIMPITGASGADAQLRELEERGLARVGSGRLSARFWRLARGRDPEGLVRKAAAEDRERGY